MNDVCSALSSTSRVEPLVWLIVPSAAATDSCEALPIEVGSVANEASRDVAGVHRSEDAAQHGDAQCAAGFARRVIDS